MVQRKRAQLRPEPTVSGREPAASHPGGRGDGIRSARFPAMRTLAMQSTRA